MKANIIQVIAKWVFILCIPVLLISASIAWGFNSLWIYNYGFQKYNVSQTTGLSPTELKNVAKSMITYFNSSGEFVQISVDRDGKTYELFTVEEQIHLKDVKQLVWLDYKIMVITLVLFLVYSVIFLFWRSGKYRQQLARNIIWGSGITLGVILVMGIAVLVDFDSLWLQFHFLSFSNDFWSAQGYMILLFGGFWFDAALICIGFIVGLALILGGLSLVFLLRKRNKYSLTTI